MARGHGDKLARKAEEAVTALLANGTLTEAAAACGLAERTLKRWLKDPEFLALYRAARRRHLEQAVGRLQAVSTKAVAKLEKLLDCGHLATEVKAATTILDRALGGTVLTDVTEKVEELEQALTRLSRGESRRPEKEAGRDADPGG